MLNLDDLYVPLLGMTTRRLIEPTVGARYLSTARWLREFDTWPGERRTEWQEQRLAAVVDHARRNVPFYRELLAGRNSVDLQDLPVVDKARIRPSMSAFLSQDWQQIPHILKHTGGTTGDPWRYPLGKDGWGQIYGAALRFREDLGYRYGERVVLVGTPQSLAPGAPAGRPRCGTASSAGSPRPPASTSTTPPASTVPDSPRTHVPPSGTATPGPWRPWQPPS